MCLPPVRAGKYDPANHGPRLNTRFRAPPGPADNPLPASIQPPVLSLSALLGSTLKAQDQELRERFEAGARVENLLHTRARNVDELVTRAWHATFNDPGLRLTLAAVGGYGRGELHPCSDVDLLVLLPTGELERCRAAIEQFIACLWDAGLHASHSVRTIEDCVAGARTDLSTATSLMEVRYLDGDRQLFEQLQTAMSADSLWPAAAFLDGKRREQASRHAKYHDTPGQLEPNIKEGPGGLRDLQTVLWVAQRHFGVRSFPELLAGGFLAADEYQALQKGQEFLWRIRFALHLMYGRHEDRLLFDAQPQLASHFGYRDSHGLRAVENFMQDYYRVIKELGLLNEILLQALEETLKPGNPASATPLSERFETHDGLLRMRTPGLFAQDPVALLEMFSVWQQHPRLKGVEAATLRALRANLIRLDEHARTAPGMRMLFMQILRAPAGVTHTLRRMSRHGVLARYIPAFGAIVGRMQYDLFHAYTVDEHVLAVVSNLRRFALTRYDQEFPFCSQIMQALPKPELAYLAALFHDIAKGRGGDHSELGADDAETFCVDHGLSPYDARLVAWLVRNHLLLSRTAQKRDIHDPQVIQEFVRTIGDQTHLDYLYVLTVADVRGTNPELWNSWKAGLFSALYRHATLALHRGLEEPIEKDELLREIKEQALGVLQDNGMQAPAAASIWSAFTEDYFLHHTADEIAWHTVCLSRLPGGPVSGAFVRQQSLHGGTAIAICSHADATIFERVTAALAELGLTILDARLTPLRRGERLDTYMVLEDTHDPISNPERLTEIEQCLQHELQRRGATPLPVTRRAPRQVRMFTTPVEVQFNDTPRHSHTIMEVSAGDRPGLLSLIGAVLRNQQIRLQNAKITTVGERAEDVFSITDGNNQPVPPGRAREELRAALEARLGEPN